MKFSIKTLGCKVNLCESDEISRELIGYGFQRVDHKNGDSDICIINTCTVTSESDRKTRQSIRRIKNTNKEAKIIVMGCFVENNRKFLENSKIDILVDNDEKNDLQKLAAKIVKMTADKIIAKNHRSGYIRKAQKHSRPIIKIQDGCEQNCTYCIIPKVRGGYRSTDSIEIIKKIKDLVENGFEEVVLTGIHIGKYGEGPGKIYGLSHLTADIMSDTAIKRLRISSIEINEIDDGLLAIIAENKERVAHHFHIPLQSGSDAILQKMARPYDRAYYIKNISRIRKVLPDITITTDIMTGFPEESDKDFNDTLELVKKIKFSKIHVFKYSPRPGTKAFGFVDGVDGAVKSERSRILRECGKIYRDLFISENIGKRHIVAVEAAGSDGGNMSGTSGNYIKIYFRTGIDFEKNRGKLIELTAIEKYKDGLFAH